jgi:hypothetical protein
MVLGQPGLAYRNSRRAHKRYDAHFSAPTVPSGRPALPGQKDETKRSVWLTLGRSRHCSPPPYGKLSGPTTPRRLRPRASRRATESLSNEQLVQSTPHPILMRVTMSKRHMPYVETAYSPCQFGIGRLTRFNLISHKGKGCRQSIRPLVPSLS